MKSPAIAATAIALVTGFGTTIPVGGGAAADTMSASVTSVSGNNESTTAIRRWRLPQSIDTAKVTVRPRIKTNGQAIRRTVVLQRRGPGESWQRVVTKRTSQRGRVRLVLKPLKTEITKFRLRVRGTSKHAPGKSKTLRIAGDATSKSPEDTDPINQSPGAARPGSETPDDASPTTPGSPNDPAVPNPDNPFNLCGTAVTHSVSGYVSDGSLDEISGLAASRRSSSRFWVHNDSGDGPHLYAINSSGSLEQTVSLSGVSPRDWEDLASGPGPITGEPYLFVADFGDNNRVRSNITIYRIKEPSVGSGSSSTGAFDSLTLTYPDGPHNAEALLVDPWDGSLLIVTKESGASAHLYSSGSFGAGHHSRTLQHRGSTHISEIATGGDVSPDGRSILVRGYGGVHGWTRSSGESLWSALLDTRCSLVSVGEKQGEAIAFTASGTGYLTISEKTGAAVNVFTFN